MRLAVLLLLGVATRGLADQRSRGLWPQRQAQYGQPQYGKSRPNSLPANYNFAWEVKDDYSQNDYGQTEKRDGDLTKGQYHILLPDGRTQKVTYTVDGYSGKTEVGCC